MNKHISLNSKKWRVLIVTFMMLFLHSSQLEAKIVKELKLENINQLLKHIPKEGKVLVASDWDNTISLIDGCVDPLRENQQTLEVIGKIKDTGHPFLIVTSRMHGYSKTNRRQGLTVVKVKDELAKNLTMLTATKIPSLEPIFDPDKTKGLVELNNRKNKVIFNSVLIDKNIMFAGSHTDYEMKGPALTWIIDQDYLLTKPEIIVFIDDDPKYIASVREAFKDRDEQVILLYYELPNRQQYSRQGFESCEKAANRARGQK